jgi:hypothetical protein
MAATNRFSVSPNDQYISQYVPKPFEAIYKVGINMQKEHETQQAESDALSDALNKIKVTDQVLVNTPGASQSGLGYASTGYSKYKNDIINQFSQESKKLADEYYATGDAAKFRQGVAKQKSDFANAYQKLKIAEKNSEAIDAADKLYRENKEAGRDNYIVNQLAEHGDEFIKNPYLSEYKGAPIGEALNEQEYMHKDSKDFADQVLSFNPAIKDSHGYINWKTFTGVAKERVEDYVDRTYTPDNGIGKHTVERIKRQMIAEGKPLDSKNEDGTYEFDTRFNERKAQYKQGLIDLAVKNTVNEDRKKDWEAAQDRSWAHDKKVANDAINIVGNSLPGDEEVNMVVQSPEFKNLSSKGLINVKPGGIIDFNFEGKQSGYQAASGKVYNTKDEAINDNKKSGIINPDTNFKEIPRANKNLSTQDLQEMNNFVINAAKMIGYSTDQIQDMMRGNKVNAKGEKISWQSQMSNIASSYNVLSKSRLGGVELSADIQKVETDKINSSPTSYTVYDPKTQEPSSLVLNKGDVQKAGERVYIKGQAFLKATIQRGKDSNGEPLTETVYIKPKSKNVNDYFDRGVGTTQKAIMSLYGSGGNITQKHADNFIEGYDAKKDSHVSVNLDTDNDPFTPSTPVRVSTFARGQLGQGVSYEFIRNDKTPTQQVYVLHVPGEDPSKPMVFNDYNEFLVYSDAAYYQAGHGKSDLAHLRSKYEYERSAGKLAPVVEEDDNN